MKTITEFNTVKELVDHLLKVDVRCRNDDKWLTYQVMRHFTKIYIPFEDFNKLPALETVKRTRAIIQNVEGRYPPTDPKVIDRRERRQKKIVKWLGKY